MMFFSTKTSAFVWKTDTPLALHRLGPSVAFHEEVQTVRCHEYLTPTKWGSVSEFVPKQSIFPSSFFYLQTHCETISIPTKHTQIPTHIISSLLYRKGHGLSLSWQNMASESRARSNLWTGQKPVALCRSFHPFPQHGGTSVPVMAGRWMWLDSNGDVRLPTGHMVRIQDMRRCGLYSKPSQNPAVTGLKLYNVAQICHELQVCVNSYLFLGIAM